MSAVALSTNEYCCGVNVEDLLKEKAARIWNTRTAIESSHMKNKSSVRAGQPSEAKIASLSPKRGNFRHVWPVAESTKRYVSAATKNEPYEQKILVTPEIAEVWRQSTAAVEARIGHRLNRNASLNRIESIAEMISADQFPYVGDTIKLSPPDPETGEPIIVDGWHRVCAIIKAGKPVTLLVVFNVPHELFPYIDIGRSRSAGDLLAVNGFSGQHLLAGAARIVWLLERKKLGVTRAEEGVLGGSLNAVIPNPTIISTVERHRDLIHWVNEISKSDKPLRKAMVVACSYWIKATGDPRAETFLSGLLSGEGLKPLSPITTLRRRIINQVKTGPNERMLLIGAFFNAWEYFRRGEERERIFGARIFTWPGGAPYIDPLFVNSEN